MQPAAASSTWRSALPSYSFVQSGLLIVTVALAAIALVPSLSTGTALALRSVGLVGAGIQLVNHWSQGSAVERVSRFVKILILILALAAVATKTPKLATIAFSIGLGISVIDCAHALYKKEKALSLLYLGILVVNAFALTAMLTGSWRYLVTASALTGVVCLGMALFRLFPKINSDSVTKYDTIDFICTLALAFLVGLGSSLRAAEITTNLPTTSHFSVKNEYDSTMELYDARGQHLQTLQRGQSVSFALPANQTLVIPRSNLFPYSGPTSEIFIKYPDINPASFYRWHAHDIETIHHIIRPALSPAQFPNALTINDLPSPLS